MSFEPPADEAGVEGGLAAQFGDHAAITDAGPTAHSDAPFFNGPGDAVSVSPLGDAHGEPLMGSADAGASAGDPSVLTDAGASESGGSSGGRVTGSSSSGSGSASGGTGSSGGRDDAGSSSGGSGTSGGGSGGSGGGSGGSGGSGSGSSGSGGSGSSGSGSSGSSGGQGCSCGGGLTLPLTGINCAAVVIDPTLPPGQAKKACKSVAGFMDTKLACGQQGTYVTCDTSPGGTLCQVATQVAMTLTCQ